MPLVDVLGASTKNNAMNDTWGHLFPKPSTKYKGKVLVTSDLEGNKTMAGRYFPTLESSPQEFHLACSVIEMFDFTPGVHEVECTLWFFKNSDDMWASSKPFGKVIRPTLKTLYSFNNLKKEYDYS